MCGHVGTAGVMSAKHEQAFRDLLVVDVLRGPDSTGIMGASSFDGVQIVKKALLPNDLFTLRATENLFRSFNYILMGHNRWATQGAVNGVNAHPFQFEDLVGTHNGTLINQSLLPDSENFEVDSENVFHSIQSIGVSKTYELLHGAASLVWFEEDKRQLSFLRNKERPMFITYTEDRRSLFWASESWMLEGVLAKNGIKHTDIYNTEVDKLYEFHIPHHTDPIKQGQEKMCFPKVKITPLQAYIPVKKYVPQRTDWRNGDTSTNTGAGGINATGYEIGQEIYFYLNPNKAQGKRYLDCIDSKDFSKVVRIYCAKSSWLRVNAEARDTDLYLGKVNGIFKSGDLTGVVIQENSVFSVDEGEDAVAGVGFDKQTGEIYKAISDDDIPFSLEEFSLSNREYQERVLARCKSECGICGEETFPHPKNHCLSDNAILCDKCIDTDLAQEYIKLY